MYTSFVLSLSVMTVLNCSHLNSVYAYRWYSVVALLSR